MERPGLSDAMSASGNKTDMATVFGGVRFQADIGFEDQNVRY
jgi:hypothetical protein